MAGAARTVTVRRLAGVLGGIGLGALGGFVASLLRRRPPTVYTAPRAADSPNDVQDAKVGPAGAQGSGV